MEDFVNRIEHLSLMFKQMSLIKVNGIAQSRRCNLLHRYRLDSKVYSQEIADRKCDLSKRKYI